MIQRMRSVDFCYLQCHFHLLLYIQISTLLLRKQDYDNKHDIENVKCLLWSPAVLHLCSYLMPLIMASTMLH